MSKNIRIIFVILIVVFVFFVTMIFRFYFNVNTTHLKDEPQTNTVKFLQSGLYSFKNEKGFYGVKDNQGRIKIDAVWRDVDSIGKDKFIVSKYESDAIRYGIIDINENIIVPFIYSSIENKSNEYLLGKVDNGKDNGGYIILDTDGNILIDEEWDECFKKYENKLISSSGNYIQTEKNGNIYRIRNIDSSKMKMYFLELQKNIFDQKLQVRINNLGSILKIGNTHTVYNEIVDNMIEYITALFENDSAVLKNLSYDGEYRKLQLENLNMRGGSLEFTGKVTPSVSLSKDSKIEYTCSVAIIYSYPESIEWDGTYTNSTNAVYLEIQMKKNQDGILKISKVQAEETEIMSLDIPDEYIEKLFPSQSEDLQE